MLQPELTPFSGDTLDHQQFISSFDFPGPAKVLHETIVKTTSTAKEVIGTNHSVAITWNIGSMKRKERGFFLF